MQAPALSQPAAEGGPPFIVSRPAARAADARLSVNDLPLHEPAEGSFSLAGLRSAGALHSVAVQGQTAPYLGVRLRGARLRDLLDGEKREAGTNTPPRAGKPSKQRLASGGMRFVCQRGVKRKQTAAKPSQDGVRGGALLKGLEKEPLKLGCPFRFTVTECSDGTVVVKIEEAVLAAGHTHATDQPTKFLPDWVRAMVELEFADNPEVDAHHVHTVVLQVAQQLAVMESGLRDHAALLEAQLAGKVTPTRAELLTRKDVNSILNKLRKKGNSLAGAELSDGIAEFLARNQADVFLYQPGTDAVDETVRLQALQYRRPLAKP